MTDKAESLIQPDITPSILDILLHLIILTTLALDPFADVFASQLVGILKGL
jgi:hypothetical protein